MLQSKEPLPRVNIDEPRWDQTAYWGRAKYFFTTTNPLNIFCSSSELDKAKVIVDKYRYMLKHDRLSWFDFDRETEMVLNLEGKFPKLYHF